MDQGRLDQLAKSLSESTSARRRLLSFIAIAVMPSATGAVLPEAALAGDQDRRDKKKRRRRRKRNRCTKPDSQCNVNRPSECCSKKCCFDSTSSSNGTCSSKGGECCGDRPFGGYCPVEFPQCCGSNSCCGSSQTCCVNIGGRGVWCNHGFVCTFDGSGCVAAQGVSDAVAEGGIQRRHFALSPGQ